MIAVVEQVTEVGGRGGGVRQYRISGSMGSGELCPPEAVSFMVPQTSLDWSISVKSYLTIIMEKKRPVMQTVINLFCSLSSCHQPCFNSEVAWLRYVFWEMPIYSW